MNRTEKYYPNTPKEESVLLPVPMLPPERKSPASVHSVTLIKHADNSDTMRIVIKRDLSVKISSFTLRYRFSALPVYAPDTAHKFSTYLYTDEDLNSSELITITGNVPAQLTKDGCSAYISEITLSSGQILAFEPSEFRFVRRPIAKNRNTPKPQNSPASSGNTSQQLNKVAEANTRKKPALSPEKKRRRLVVILSALVLMFVVEIIAGISLYRYLGVKNSADMLIKDNRFNEAYKIAYDSEYDSILQRVCEKAVEHYIDKGDLEASYVYAYGAPNSSLCDVIIDYAAASVVDINTGKINENAFRVAKMSENDEKFSSIIRSMCDILKNRGDYVNALLVASEMRDPDERDKYENTVFNDALIYYIYNNRYNEAAAFIDELPNIVTFDITKQDAINAAIDCCVTLDDNAGIIYLADRYPEYAKITSAQAGIDSGDSGVRAELDIIYPMLTEDQKRIYHSQSISVWNDDVRIIKSGKIAGAKITDAVSVDTNEIMSIVLRKNGKVSLIPHEGETLPFTAPSDDDVIQAVLGKDHAVLLHANGTVSAIGDNTYGQCDVDEWNDIVAVAAGQRFTVGLKIDGTLVATGSNSCGQCDVEPYRNVVDVAACNQTTVMLFSDGTVMIRGYRSMGLLNVENAKNITRIKAGASAILTEKRDGTYQLYSGQIGGSYGNPYNWRNMEAFDVGVVCIAGIDESGALYHDGDGVPNKNN